MFRSAVFVIVIAFSVHASDVPTFNKDIAPILFNNCTVCHRPGEIGPFSLLNYVDAKKRSRIIKIATKMRVMPPWKPQPEFGEFKHERRLSESQIDLIQRWAEGGMPEGDARDLPPAPVFPSGWILGTPDLVVKFPEPFQIPAEGSDVYRNFVLALPVPSDTYIRGIEVRPGNRRVAHHAVSLLDSSGAARKLDEKSQGPGYPGLGNAGFLPSGILPGYVPGQMPRFFAEGCSAPLKKNTDLVLQMHYHPSGKPEIDQTEVALYFTKEAPYKKQTGILMGAEDIDIPAGEKQHVLKDTFQLPVDIEATGIWAHMHMIGKEVMVNAELPDGKVVPLVWINDWDFNWQDNYAYKEPISLPKGTKIHATFTFDNSAENLRNPNDPPKRVRRGENSTDEMAGVIIGGLAHSDVDNLAMLAANVGHVLDVGARAAIARAIREHQEKNAADKDPGKK